MKKYLSKEGVRRLTSAKVEDYVIAALQDKDIEGAALGVKGLIYHPEETELDVVEFVERLPENENSIDLFKSILD